MLVLGVVLLLVSVWLCAYGAVRVGWFYVFYAMAVIPVPLLIGWMYHAALGGSGVSAGSIILAAMSAAALFYPLNVRRLSG